MEKSDPAHNPAEVPDDIFKALFDLAPTPQAIFDASGRCLLANRAFYSRLMSADAPPAARSIMFRDIVDTKGSANEFLRELSTRQIIRRWEMNIQDQDRGLFPALVSGRLFDFSGQMVFEISFIDISRQKRFQNALRKEHLRLSSVVDSLAAGIFLVNQEGQITEVNHYLAALLSISPDQLVLQPYQKLFDRLILQAQEPVLVQQSLHNIISELKDRPALSFAIQKEKTIHLEAAFFPMLDKKDLLIGWGGLLQDTTELQDQISWKLELLSILAHDLRTPLATLKGYVSALLGNFRQWDSEMVSEFLAAIEHGVDSLTHQVDQSLALTRVETGHLGLLPEAVNCERLIRESLERAGGLLGETPVELNLPEDLPEVRVDPARVEEVLINLLENAVRYSPVGEPIQIQVRAEENWVVITVADSGPGLSNESQGRVFEKYVKDPTELGGTGMGLFISRKIIEAHGGRIWVDSPPRGADHGAAFSLTLPVMPPLDERKLFDRSEVKIEPVDLEDSPRVLIIDDDPDTQVLLRAILIEEGYRVEVAGDGPTAMDILQASPTHIVLLDWVLPGMSGLSVCRGIRRWSEVPIMMITSKTSHEDLAAALDAGADDYVTKPFVGSEIIARIRALLRRGESWTPTREEDRFRADGLVIDFESRQAWLGGEMLPLTPTEYQLLAFLARNPRRVWTYDQVIAGVWGEGGVTRHGLFAHISRLRRKLESDSGRPHFIATRWGIGYIFLPQYGDQV